MNSKYKSVTVGLIPDYETKFNDALLQSSVFFQYAFSLDASCIVGPLANDAKKHESLGHLWEAIKPQDGKYTFEIATELPYYLPDLNGKAEYNITFKDATLLVCNRMVRAFCGEGLPKDTSLKYYLAHRKALPSLVEQNTGGIHPLPLKTMIISEYKCQASSAEEAIEANFISWQENLLSHISHLVDLFRMVDPRRVKHLLPHAAVSAFPIFWVAVKGDQEQLGCQQFTGDVGAIAQRAVHNVTGKQYEHLMNYINDNSLVPQYEMGMGLAITFLHYRYYELALIQVCTACETVLSKCLREHLLTRNISSSHVKQYFEDVTFSHLLNLHLPNIRDLTILDDYQEVIGRLNWARKRRNEIVHEGQATTQLKENDVKNAIDAAGRLIGFVMQPK